MPTYDLGYRPWQGAHAPVWLRWLAITATGIALAWKSKMVRRLVFFAWLPAFYFGGAFFLYEQWVKQPPAFRKLYAFANPGEEIRIPWAQQFGLSRELQSRLATEPGAVRAEVWTHLFYTFLCLSQAMLLVVLVGLVAPGLISQDVRTRAFLLYFSRPLTRFEYILGKGAVVGTYVAILALAPALLLYTFAVALSPSLSVVYDTWAIPLRLVGTVLVVTLPATALALALSSLTTESRYAAFAWFAIWVLGAVAYGTLSSSGLKGEEWHLLSLLEVFRILAAWAMGIRQLTQPVANCLYLAAGVFALSIAVVHHRISAPMKV